MAFNPARKMADNIAAIRIALDFTGRQLTETELQTLKKYAGFGGLKAVLFPAGEITEWEKFGASNADLKLYPRSWNCMNCRRKN